MYTIVIIKYRKRQGQREAISKVFELKVFLQLCAYKVDHHQTLDTGFVHLPRWLSHFLWSSSNWFQDIYSSQKTNPQNIYKILYWEQERKSALTIFEIFEFYFPITVDIPY